MNRYFRILIASLAVALAFGALPENADAQQYRKVIIEEGTNASCGPCATQNPRFKKWISDHKGRVIPVIYHASWPGSNDPMYQYNTAMNTGRISTYYGMTGVPSARVNGLIAPFKKDFYEGAPGDTNGMTAKMNEFLKFSPINLTVSLTNDNGSGKVSVEASSLFSISMNLKLRVVVCNLHHFYAAAGNNGEKDFYYIARKMLPTHDGTNISFATAGEVKTFSFDYTVDADMADDLYAVAFIQNDVTKEILQAESTLDWEADIPKFAAMSNSLEAPFAVLGDGGNYDVNYTFINNGDEDVTIELASAKSARTPGDWTVTSSEQGEFSVEAKASKSVSLSISPNSTVGIADITPMFLIKSEQFDDIAAPVATVLHSDVQSLQILDGPNDYSLASIINAAKGNSNYIEITSEQYLANSTKIQNLKYAVWNTSSNGVISTADISAIMNLMSNNVGMLLCGGSINSGMQSGGGLGMLGISFKFYSREGFGSAPYRIWISGVADDPITGDFGASKEGNLILYLTPIYSIDNPTTTKPILAHTKHQDSIFAVRVTKANSRHVYIGTNPFIIVDAQTRDNLIKKAIQWIETGTTDVEPDILINEELTAAPNPAGAYSTVAFAVSGANSQAVKLSLYDNLGRELMVLKDEILQPGSYTTEFNASGLAPGIYRLALTSQKGTKTIPFAVVR